MPSSSRPRRAGSRSSRSGWRGKSRDVRRAAAHSRLALSLAAAAPAAGDAATRADIPRARVHEDDRLPARLDPGGDRGARSSAQERLRRRPDRGRGAFTTRTSRGTGRRLPAHDRRRPRRRPAARLQRFIEAGDGWVGVHSAADTEYDWPWYGGLLGAYFASHPAIQQATLDVTTHDPSTAGAAATWMRTDEWYGFRTEPAARCTCC